MKRKLIWLLPILVGLAIVILFQTVLLIGYVPSESMEPTLEKGSLILGTRILGELEVGDIVVFKRDGGLMVKRIAAGPNEEITVDGKTYYVPGNSYFMFGDNSENSYDSRYWENPYVSHRDIVAKSNIPVNGIGFVLLY